jgi:hypothetical protein
MRPTKSSLLVRLTGGMRRPGVEPVSALVRHPSGVRGVLRPQQHTQSSQTHLPFLPLRLPGATAGRRMVRVHHPRHSPAPHQRLSLHGRTQQLVSQCDPLPICLRHLLCLIAPIDCMWVRVYHPHSTNMRWGRVRLCLKCSPLVSAIHVRMVGSYDIINLTHVW